MAKKIKEKVCCMDCKHAFLMQWDKNPIISNCKDEGRQVANTPHDCSHYVKATEKKEIKHYTHYT